MITSTEVNVKSFLQSPEWEEFQKSMGRKTWRIDGNLIIRHDLPGGFNYLYCPRPGLVTNNWLLEIEKIAQGENSIFLKIDPFVQLPVTNHKLLITKPIQPQKTVVLDLQKSENELFSEMHEKTRYNIRLAERHGVKIAYRDFKTFWNLLQETARRDAFYTHEKRYYKRLLATRSEDFSNELFFAEYQGKILATALVNFYQPASAAMYLHGASSREHKEVMASHFLHRYIIREAKRRRFQYYDLWGIDEKKWPGVTRFKLGFGGTVMKYPASFDIIYRRFWYKVYFWARNIL